MDFYLGGPAPCGRRRAIRCTTLRSCRSYPCRDRGMGRCRQIPFCHGVTGIPIRTHAVRPYRYRQSCGLPWPGTSSPHVIAPSPHRRHPARGAGVGSAAHCVRSGMVTGRLGQTRGKMGGGGDCNKLGTRLPAAHLPPFYCIPGRPPFRCRRQEATESPPPPCKFRREEIGRSEREERRTVRR